MQATFPSQIPDDFGDFPSMTRCDVQLFTSNNLNLNWQSWKKPRGVTMLSILAIAGGGGGGGGFTRTAGNPGGGGGGGACSGHSRLLIPAFFVPDTLYVQVGNGGLGGGPTVAGGNGTNSYVSFGRSATIPNPLIMSGANAPGGGGAGTAGAGGAAGNIPSIATILPPAGLGYWFGIAGLVGLGGGAQTGAVGASATAVWNNVLCGPGAGGAGCTTTDFAGGAVTLQGTPDWPALSLVGGLAAGGNGNAGIQMYQPFGMTGGSGGGSNNSGQAGNGGKGGIGSGGGGGGAGATGGKGGDGGNGLVLIVAW